MAVYTKKHKWSRWAGSMQDLAAATRFAMRTLEDLHGGPIPDPDDPGAPPLTSEMIGPATARIEVETPSLHMQLGGPDELEREVGIKDLPAVKVIRIHIERRLVDTNLQILLQSGEKDPALTVQAQGNNRTEVEGLASRLAEQVAGGGQVPRGALGFVAVLLAIAMVVAGVHALSHVNLLNGDKNTPPLGTALAFLLVFAAIGVVLSVYWLCPTLELTPPGVEPRLKRFRSKVLAGVITILAGVVAAAIWAAVGGR